MPTWRVTHRCVSCIKRLIINKLNPSEYSFLHTCSYLSHLTLYLSVWITRTHTPLTRFCGSTTTRWPRWEPWTCSATGKTRTVRRRWWQPPSTARSSPVSRATQSFISSASGVSKWLNELTRWRTSPRQSRRTGWVIDTKWSHDRYFKIFQNYVWYAFIFTCLLIRVSSQFIDLYFSTD